jgi:hypothetical protein
MLASRAGDAPFSLKPIENWTLDSGNPLNIEHDTCSIKLDGLENENSIENIKFDNVPILFKK